jgi:hypothetical protein
VKTERKRIPENRLNLLTTGDRIQQRKSNFSHLWNSHGGSPEFKSPTAHHGAYGSRDVRRGSFSVFVVRHRLSLLGSAVATFRSGKKSFPKIGVFDTYIALFGAKRNNIGIQSLSEFITTRNLASLPPHCLPTKTFLYLLYESQTAHSNTPCPPAVMSVSATH